MRRGGELAELMDYYRAARIVFIAITEADPGNVPPAAPLRRRSCRITAVVAARQHFSPREDDLGRLGDSGATDESHNITDAHLRLPLARLPACCQVTKSPRGKHLKGKQTRGAGGKTRKRYRDPRGQDSVDYFE